MLKCFEVISKNSVLPKNTNDLKEEYRLKKIMVTGALGQIGSELIAKLQEEYGEENVLSTDIRQPEKSVTGPFEVLDVTDGRNDAHTCPGFWCRHDHAYGCTTLGNSRKTTSFCLESKYGRTNECT